MLAFTPVLVWIGTDIGAWAVGIAALIALPHLVQDDGRLLATYMRRIKGIEPDDGEVAVAVDQTVHLVALFIVSLLDGSSNLGVTALHMSNSIMNTAPCGLDPCAAIVHA